MNELTKPQSCIILRNGMQIWIDSDKAEKLQDVLQGITGSKFVKVDDKTFNSADITGIFPARDMDEFIRIKRGEWKCKKGFWHAKNEECMGHREYKQPETETSVNRASRETVEKCREELSSKLGMNFGVKNGN